MSRAWWAQEADSTAAAGHVDALSTCRHSASGECDPSNYARVHGKPRCPVPRCKAKLTSVTSFTCKACGQAVCLAHRHPSDHGCEGARAAMQQRTASAATGRLTSALGRMLSFGSGETAAPAVAAQSAPRPASKSPGSVLQRLFGGGSDNQPRRPPPLPESCPSCSARFATVAELIAHAEQRHAGGWASGPVGAPRQQQLPERCPRCTARFADPASLIAHVERVHRL